MRTIRTLLPFLLLLVVFLAPGIAQAGDDIQLFLDGKKLTPEVPPRIVNDITMVPVRIVAENMGAKVGWLESQRKVTVEKDETKIELQIDNPNAVVNGIAHSLEAAPFIENGNTMLPARFVAEQLGIAVLWDDLTRSVMFFKPVREANAGDTPVDKPSSKQPDGTGSGPQTKPIGNGGQTGGTGGGSQAKPSGTDGKAGDGGSTRPGSGDSGQPGKNAGGDNGTASPQKPGDNTGRTATLLGVEIREGKFVIQTDGDIDPSHFTLSNPNRLVIDLPNTALPKSADEKPGVREMAVDHPLAHKIRYAQHSLDPAVVRIVIDLKGKVGYSLVKNAKKKELTVTLSEIKYKIVIDAGHGGSDPGASSISNKQEKDFTLAVANKLYKLLQETPSVQTIMTRTDDSYPTLQDRVDLANNAKADLFISIHGNKFEQNPAISGTETYYYDEKSLEFARLVHRYVVEAAGLPDRNVRQANFKVLRDTTMPAVLLEIGYLSNERDEKLMLSESFQNKVAASIVDAIKAYFQIT